MHFCFETCADLPPVPAGYRGAIAAGPVTASGHARVLHTTEALHRIKVGPPSAPLAAHADSLRVAFWNAERCKYRDGAADLLARAGAGVTRLSEMDLGMARSGQIHTTRQLAQPSSVSKKAAIGSTAAAANGGSAAAWRSPLRCRSGIQTWPSSLSIWKATPIRAIGPNR